MSKETEAGVKTDDQGAPLDSEVKNESDASPDFEEMYKKERERAENYKRAMLEKKQFLKKPQEETTEDDENKPLTRKDVRELLQQEVAPMVSVNKEESLLNSKITDPAKRKLVKFYLDNRIKRTGTSDEALSEDIDFAINAIDGNTFRRKNEEIVRSLDNKPSDKSNAGSSQEKDIDTLKLDPQLKKQLEERARVLGIDPAKFIADFQKNLSRTPTLG